MRIYIGEFAQPLKMNVGVSKVLQLGFGKKNSHSLFAILEWAFRYHYVGMFSHLALAKYLPSLGERVHVMCYDKLESPDHDAEALNGALDFWFNGTEHAPYAGSLPGHQNYTGGHSTSHDPALRSHLIDVVKQIDEKYYNGEIAWANSWLPC